MGMWITLRKAKGIISIILCTLILCQSTVVSQLFQPPPYVFFAWNPIRSSFVPIVHCVRACKCVALFLTTDVADPWCCSPNQMSQAGELGGGKDGVAVGSSSTRDASYTLPSHPLPLPCFPHASHYTNPRRHLSRIMPLFSHLRRTLSLSQSRLILSSSSSHLRLMPSLSHSRFSGSSLS